MTENEFNTLAEFELVRHVKSGNAYYVWSVGTGSDGNIYRSFQQIRRNAKGVLCDYGPIGKRMNAASIERFQGDGEHAAVIERLRAKKAARDAQFAAWRAAEAQS